DWQELQFGPLDHQATIKTPYREILKLSDQSIGLRFDGSLGEQVEILMDAEAVIYDLWRLDSVSYASLYHDPIITSDTTRIPLLDNSTYVLRILPKLGAKPGDLTLTIHKEPLHLMPVATADNEDVWSRFGDPRDAGRRLHEGVDIFKRRGTPVLSASDGVVHAVRDQGLGGKQVWVRDDALPISHYYAHLDDQLVIEGARVSRGDTLGTVGNTGNARTTRPHLHYGMYMRDHGAIDPFPFIGEQRRVRRFRTKELPLPDSVSIAFGWRLRDRPTSRGSIVLEEGDETLRTLGWTNGWWHVLTSTGNYGFVYDDQTTYAGL
ncbi:MAG: M23 family metallopeptidase, partial [Bacteroidota bacterium]